METSLNSKGLWQYTKVSIPYQSDAQEKFVIDGKKYEAIGVIMNYISREIWFHTNGINCPREVWKILKSLFDKVDKSELCR